MENSPMNLRFLSPTKRLFLGFGAIIGGALAAMAWVAITVGFIITIGFLWTVLMELIFLLMFIICRIVWRVRALGHRFNTVREWDTTNADLEGSTARFGIPHDQGSYPARRKPDALHGQS
jgi:hypothetical protein